MIKKNLKAVMQKAEGKVKKKKSDAMMTASSKCLLKRMEKKRLKENDKQVPYPLF